MLWMWPLCDSGHFGRDPECPVKGKTCKTYGGNNNNHIINNNNNNANIYTG